MVAVLETGSPYPLGHCGKPLPAGDRSQSLATSVSLLSSSTSLACAPGAGGHAMPRLTVATKPRFSEFSSKMTRCSWAAKPRNHWVKSGSGLASLMTIRRIGVWWWCQLASTDCTQRWVSARALVHRHNDVHARSTEVDRPHKAAAPCVSGLCDCVTSPSARSPAQALPRQLLCMNSSI